MIADSPICSTMVTPWFTMHDRNAGVLAGWPGGVSPPNHQTVDILW
jgi:hypothetical protein